MRSKFLILGLLGLVFCYGCARDGSVTEARARATPSALPTEKFVTRNNAASLLFQLVEDEKNVGTLLIIKGNRKDIANLVKAIAATADDASKQLQLLAKSDPSLNLHSVDLPAGEVAARTAIARVKTHELLLSTGDNFEFALLLSQSEALSYGYNLAQIAGDNCENPAQRQTFTALRDTMKSQYQQVIALIRGPAK